MWTDIDDVRQSELGVVLTGADNGNTMKKHSWPAA